VISATIDTRFLLVIEDKEHQLGKRAGNAHRVPLANRLELFRTLLVKLVLHSFLMVDQVTRIEGNEITAIKNVTIDEPYFQGHFPGHPIMPGVLQLEAMAQVAGILTLKQADSAGKIAYFMSAEKVKWRKPVKPGDVLQIDIKLLKARSKVAKARGVCTVRGEVVSEAEITFSLVDNR